MQEDGKRIEPPCEENSQALPMHGGQACPIDPHHCRCSLKRSIKKMKNMKHHHMRDSLRACFGPSHVLQRDCCSIVSRSAVSPRSWCAGIFCFILKCIVFLCIVVLPLFVCLFVCWYKTRKTILHLLFLEGSKSPGNDHTRTQALLCA